MARVSSTTLKTWNSHCAAAALRQLAFEDDDRSPYTVGTAAHSALEALAREKTIRAARIAVTAMLMGRREYKGHREPPYAPGPCMDGLRLATRWCDEMGLPRGKPEVGVAVSATWDLVDYGSPEYHYGQLLDLVRIYEDTDEDEEPIRVLSITDYKSAWSAGLDEVGSLQMRGAILLGAALATREGCDAVEVQIANLRKVRLYPETPRRYYPRRPHHAFELDGWREEIDLAVRAIQELSGQSGQSPDSVASPGLGCAGCPCLPRCKPAMEFHGPLIQDGDVVALAQTWTVTEAVQAQRRRLLKTYEEDHGAIELPDGVSEVGHAQVETDALSEDAIPKLSAALEWPPEVETWIRRLGATAGNVNRLLKSLYDAEYLPGFIQALRTDVIGRRRTRRWGTWRKAEVDS